VALLVAGAVLLVAIEIALLHGQASLWVTGALLTLTAAWFGLMARAVWLLASDARLHLRLAEIGRELSALREGGELLDRLVDAIATLVPHADKCVVHLMDERGGRLYPYFTSVAMPDAPVGPATGMPADQGIAGQALRDRRAITVPDVTRAPGFLPLSSGLDLRALLVAPFYVAEQSLGTLSLNSRAPNAFSKRDAYIVSTLAGFASNAFYRTRLLSSESRRSRHLTAVADLVDDALAVVDEGNRIVRHNAALLQLLGMASGDLVGCSLDAPPQGEPTARLAEILGELRRPVADRVERRVTVKEPLYAHLQVTRIPLPDQGNGEWLQGLLIRDETRDRERLAAQSDLAAAAARELWALQHGLGNVIALPKASVQERLTSHALATVRRLAADLADPCLAAATTDCLERQPVDLSVLLLEVYRRHGQGIDLSTGALGIRCPDNLPLLMLDQERLARALLGLFANVAHRALPDSSAEVTIRQEGAEIAITVTDSGRPIPLAERERILRSAFRLGEALSGDPASTGLELYACKRIVEAHGGQMWMPDTTDGTTRFCLLLPVDVARNGLGERHGPIRETDSAGHVLR
jgi:PAS domain S-box-containing protein